MDEIGKLKSASKSKNSANYQRMLQNSIEAKRIDLISDYRAENQVDPDDYKDFYRFLDQNK